MTRITLTAMALLQNILEVIETIILLYGILLLLCYFLSYKHECDLPATHTGGIWLLCSKRLPAE